MQAAVPSVSAEAAPEVTMAASQPMRDERNLQALRVEYQIKTEEAHRARADALGMLQLLSRRHAGKTLLAHLLGW